MKIRVGRMELMWARWTSSFLDHGYVAGGWVRVWYIWRLRIGWLLKVQRDDKWDAQSVTYQTPVA